VTNSYGPVAGAARRLTFQSDFLPKARLPGHRPPMAGGPVAELPNGTLLGHVLLWQVSGLILMVCHVLLVRDNIWLVPIVPLIVGWLYLNAPLSGLIVYFQILIYQNLIVSIFSPGMEYQPTYVTLLGTNFAVLSVIALIALYQLTAPHWQRVRALVWLVLAALAMLAFYTLFGATKAGMTSALVYFRNFASPLFAILVGLDIGRTWGFKTVGVAFLLSAALAIGLGIIEYAAPLSYYEWTNTVDYLGLKYSLQPGGRGIYVPQDIIDVFNMVFLNISGEDPSESLMHTFRFGGPIITPTSFAYLLSVTGLTAICVRRSAWLAIVLPLLFLIGAKGASLLLLLTLTVWWVWKLSRSKYFAALSGAILSIAYVAFGIIFGLERNDYHIVGFLGGVHGLIADPLGHGIGVGGNLSAVANAGFKIDGPGGFTRLGAEFALESAIGVLIYQTGVASLLYFAAFGALVYLVPLGDMRGNQVLPARRDIMAFAVAMIVVNGVFQEEAYSPYAAGMIALLCACMVANGRRREVSIAPSSNRRGFGISGHLREPRAEPDQLGSYLAVPK
jgi:hypothetical protein